MSESLGDLGDPLIWDVLITCEGLMDFMVSKSLGDPLIWDVLITWALGFFGF